MPHFHRWIFAISNPEPDVIVFSDPNQLTIISLWKNPPIFAFHSTFYTVLTTVSIVPPGDFFQSAEQKFDGLSTLMECRKNRTKIDFEFASSRDFYQTSPKKKKKTRERNRFLRPVFSPSLLNHFWKKLFLKQADDDFKTPTAVVACCNFFQESYWKKSSAQVFYASINNSTLPFRGENLKIG